MQLCFDATRFGFGLKDAVLMAAARQVSSVAFTFQPFAASVKQSAKLSQMESGLLAEVDRLCREHKVEIAVLNLDFLLVAEERTCVKKFRSMIAKLSQVAAAVGCRRIAIWLDGGAGPAWQASAEAALSDAAGSAAQCGVKLLLRLSTPSLHRGRSLSYWRPLCPRDWRELLSAVPGLCLSFSPADCVWQSINYLKILPDFLAAIEHIEAADVEVNRELLCDGGLFGTLWWRYRLPGKGQIDWRQLTEALKLYDFSGTFSLHLDDEFVGSDPADLEQALERALGCLVPYVEG